MEKEKYTPKNLVLWKHPDSYFGETYYNYYPVLGRHRDSDIIANSNFEVALKQLEEIEKKYEQTNDDEPFVINPSFNHWAVGWTEELMVHKDAPEEILRAADEIQGALLDYPILDEQDYFEKVSEAQYEAWKYWLRSDFEKGIVSTFEFQYNRQYCSKHCKILDMVDFDEDKLFTLFMECCDRSGEYMEDDGSIRLERVVNEVTWEDVVELTRC